MLDRRGADKYRSLSAKGEARYELGKERFHKVRGDRCRRSCVKGFLMAPWYYRTQEDKRDKIMESLDVMGEAIRDWNAGLV